MNDLGGCKAGRDVMYIAECSLVELMEDPLVRLVMKSDRVDRRELELLLGRITGELRRADAPRSTAGLRVWPRTMEAARCSPC
jgi:hypothetical protein